MLLGNYVAKSMAFETSNSSKLQMTDSISIRQGLTSDADRLAEFNSSMAFETEGIKLLPEVIGAGVNRLISDPNLGYYLVAESEGQIVASLMVTTEWSDWRNGLFWWIQSVYVIPEFRRKGLYRKLYEKVKELAAADPSICGFRLYVEKENTVAQRTYENVGMHETEYKMYEELRQGLKFQES